MESNRRVAVSDTSLYILMIRTHRFPISYCIHCIPYFMQVLIFRKTACCFVSDRENIKSRASDINSYGSRQLE